MGVSVRFSLPDRPGALATVTRALAAAGADVLAVRVLEREQGRAVDEIRLRWPAGRDLLPLLDALEGCPGVRVAGHRGSPWVLDGRPDLDLLGHLLTVPERGIETIVDMVPAVLDADWAVLHADAGGADPLHASASSPPTVPTPGPVPPRAVRHRAAGVELALIPMEQVGCVLTAVRETGPQFTRAELRDAERVVGLALATLTRVARGGPGTAPGLTARLLAPSAGPVARPA